MTKQTYKNQVWWAEAAAKPWGFAEHSNGYFWTRDPIAALNLYDKSDRAAKAALDLRRTYIKLSTATEIKPQGFDIPAGQELRPYQEAGVAFLRTTANAYLADDPGAGKTVMVCVAIRNALHPINNGVIICPVNALYIWQKHLKVWCGIDAQVITKGSDKITEPWVIMSFDQAKKHHENIDHIRDLLVVDEAAKIKNPKADRTKVILGDIATDMKRVWLLSGTPIPNGRPVELWPILARLEPSTFPADQLGWWKYVRHYCAARKNRFGWDLTGAANLGEFRLRLKAGFMMRRRLKDILPQLPPLEITMVPLDGPKALMREEAPYVREFVSTGKIPKGATAGDIAELRHKMGRAKVPATLSMINELIEDGQKVVVACHHLGVMDEIGAGLDCLYTRIDGGVSGKVRDAQVQQFQEDPDTWVMLINAAAREAITLTAASNILLVEPDWVPGNNEQWIGRVWRFGQSATHVNARILVFKGGLDDVILSKNMTKQGNIDLVVN